MIDNAAYIERIRKLETERKSLNRALSAAIVRAENAERNERGQALEIERLKRKLAELVSR